MGITKAIKLTVKFHEFAKRMDLKGSPFEVIEYLFANGLLKEETVDEFLKAGVANEKNKNL